MNRKHGVLMGMGLVMALMLQPLAAQGVSCNSDEVLTPVEGQIFNNAVQAGTTLGTVKLKLDKKKMRCGILGQGGAVGSDGAISFIHTFVCDDTVVFPPTGDTFHSQLTLNTTGYADFQVCPQGFPENAVFGPFQETSVPIPGTGRGVFAGVERGEIHIEGAINCLFAIDMKFSGEVCLKQPQ